MPMTLQEYLAVNRARHEPITNVRHRRTDLRISSPGPAQVPGFLRAARTGAWTVCWGFQSTIDYRYRLTLRDRQRLDLSLGSDDSETAVAPGEFADLMGAVARQLGREPVQTPGGSPLISTCSIGELQRWNPHLVFPHAVFCGKHPAALEPLARREGWEPALRYSVRQEGPTGSLCLEDPSHSSKTVYAVFQGRDLSEADTAGVAEQITRLSRDAGSRGIVFGIGGLNKTEPARLLELVRHIRGLDAGPRVVYVATNSFRPILQGPRRDELMPQYLELLREADIASLSAEELVQLSEWRGAGTGRGLHPLLEALELPGLSVCHHRLGACVAMGPQVRLALLNAFRRLVVQVVAGMVQYFRLRVTTFDTGFDLADLVDEIDADAYAKVFGVVRDHPHAVAAPRALAHGTAALTGLGSRFDGYLTALIPGVWSRLDALA